MDKKVNQTGKKEENMKGNAWRNNNEAENNKERSERTDEANKK